MPGLSLRQMRFHQDLDAEYWWTIEDGSAAAVWHRVVYLPPTVAHSQALARSCLYLGAWVAWAKYPEIIH